MKLSGLELIKDYREHPEKYLPMIDHTGQTPERNEYGEVNIGWNAGLLEENRPFFVECWTVDHITMLTIYVSAKGIENKTPDELDRWFQDIAYYSYRDTGEDYGPPEVRTFTNPQKDEFFSINIGVGVDEEPALIEGALIKPWSVLNEYNRLNPVK